MQTQSACNIYFPHIYSNPVCAEYAAAGTHMPKHARR